MNEVNKKKLIIFVTIIIASSIVLSIANKLLASNKINKDPKEIASYLASKYYEDNIYDRSVDSKEFVKQFSESGISFNLSSLLNDYKIKDLTPFNNCNYKNASITIYPNGSYEKDDYIIEDDLECDQ